MARGTLRATARGRDQVETVCANGSDLVRQDYGEEGRRFGLVICDPPAFAKSRTARPRRRVADGYRELNRRCMQLTEPRQLPAVSVLRAVPVHDAAAV